MTKEGEIYVEAGKSVGELVQAKNQAYGDSINKASQVMNIMFPKGIPPHQVHEALLIVRILDKLFRICSDKNAFHEDPFADIAGYGLLGMVRAMKSDTNTTSTYEVLDNCPCSPCKSSGLP